MRAHKFRILLYDENGKEEASPDLAHTSFIVTVSSVSRHVRWIHNASQRKED